MAQSAQVASGVYLMCSLLHGAWAPARAGQGSEWPHGGSAVRGGLMSARSRPHHCPAQARGRGLRSDTSPTLEAAAGPREAAGAAGSAAVGLERRPDARGQGVRCGARGRAAHRQALCGQGARCGGADGYKLNLMDIVTR